MDRRYLTKLRRDLDPRITVYVCSIVLLLANQRRYEASSRLATRGVQVARRSR